MMSIPEDAFYALIDYGTALSYRDLLLYHWLFIHLHEQRVPEAG